MRLIDADELKATIECQKCMSCNSYNGVRCSACETADAIDSIDDTPTEDAEHVRHGRWIEHNKRPCSTMFVCSVCGGIAYDAQKNKSQPKYCSYQYCPHCGAKMDGGERDGSIHCLQQ